MDQMRMYNVYYGLAYLPVFTEMTIDPGSPRLHWAAVIVKSRYCTLVRIPRALHETGVLVIHMAV